MDFMKKILFSLVLGLGLISTFQTKAINVDFTIPVKFTIPNKIAYAVPALLYLCALKNLMEQNHAAYQVDKKECLTNAVSYAFWGGITHFIAYKLNK